MLINLKYCLVSLPIYTINVINYTQFSDTQYLGQVATVANWAQNGTINAINSTCRPRKLGLPVLGRTECLGAAAVPESVSNDKGCVGVLGSVSPICQVI